MTVRIQRAPGRLPPAPPTIPQPPSSPVSPSPAPLPQPTPGPSSTSQSTRRYRFALLPGEFDLGVRLRRYFPRPGGAAQSGCGLGLMIAFLAILGGSGDLFFSTYDAGLYYFGLFILLIVALYLGVVLAKALGGRYHRGLILKGQTAGRVVLLSLLGNMVDQCAITLSTTAVAQETGHHTRPEGTVIPVGNVIVIDGQSQAAMTIEDVVGPNGIAQAIESVKTILAQTAFQKP
jgi:hypothetical protein